MLNAFFQSALVSVGSLLGAASVFHVLKTQPAQQTLPIPPWTIWQLCWFLSAMNIIGALVASAIQPHIPVLREAFGLGTVLLESYQLIAIIIFLYIFRSDLTMMGLGREQLRSEAILIGVKWGFAALCAVMFLGMVSSQAIMKSFVFYTSALGKQGELAQLGINELLSELMTVIIGMGLVSLIEEIAYRGLLYKTLRVRMSPSLAAFVSSLCFAFPHAVLSVPIFLMGYGNALLLEKYGSLVPAILIHATWNIGMRVVGWCLIVFQIDATALFKVGFLVTFLGALSAWVALRIRAHEREMEYGKMSGAIHEGRA